MKSDLIHQDDPGTLWVQEWLEKSPVPVLVLAGDEDQPGAGMLKPELLEIARRYAGRVVTRWMERSRHAELMQKWEVESSPVFMLFQKGTLIWKHQGLIRSDQVEKIINECLEQ